ncbi:MAG: glycosyltransferase family 4 protein [Saprospiraceae bacterium]|nr:glycosyltransferase family 4 protein [Saprospiraceae bacterium]
MKILFVCKTLPHTFKGGIQTHVWKLSEWLLKFGHEVSILTAGSHKNGLRTVDMGGRKIIELPYFPGRKLPLVGTFAEEFSFNIAAKNWLAKHQTQFDIIHLQGRSGALFLHSRKQIKTPVVNTLHGLISIEQDKAIGNTGNFDQKIHRIAATKMENVALRNADALIAVSDEMRSEIEARQHGLGAKTQRIYNGIDVPETLPSTAADPNLLLFVGRLTALKGVFPLVEAMKTVRKDIRLVMVGDGEARPVLEEIIAENKLQDRIQLTGSLDSKGVNAWLEQCSALILPSYHETQGIVLMEANALGKPVIATAVGGVPEVVVNRKNGLLLGNHDIKTLTWGINYLFTNSFFAGQWGQWGRFYMQEKFNWEKIPRQTEAVYQSLVPANLTNKNNSPSRNLAAIL